VNNIISERRWKRMRGNANMEQDDFSIDPPDRAEGKFEKLAGVLQEKYRYALGKADKIAEPRLRAYDQKQAASSLRARRASKRQSIGW
jgi:hypothetical protein